MLKQILITLSIIGAFAITAAGTPSFCACCVDHGYYENTRERLSKYDMDLVGDIQFASNAELYMTEAGYDGVKGLSLIQSEIEGDIDVAFDVVAAFLRRTWTIRLKTDKGRQGVLTLPMPTQVAKLKIDTHDGESDSSEQAGKMVFLYKEMSFTGRSPRGTGFLSSANAAGTTFNLIFQGHGNGCDSSADYDRWRLELRGPKTRYAILGKLKP
jgi:hypothetical protein